jgi:hypothetical protein
MSKQNSNVLILFCRTPSISQENGETQFSGLPWNDVDALFTAFVGDLLMTASHLEGTDVFVYRKPSDISDDFFIPFRHMIQLVEVTDRPFADQVERAIDSAFRMNYNHVVVLLDNDPSLKANFLRTVYDYLGYEDDCVVLCPTREGRSILIGMKTNHSKIFDSAKGDPILRPHLLLQRLCAINTHIFLTRTGRSLDSGESIRALKEKIAHIDRSSNYFPAQSNKVFTMLEKKYSRKRAAR